LILFTSAKEIVDYLDAAPGEFQKIVAGSGPERTREGSLISRLMQNGT
jgi:hypothetical protein